MTVSIVVEKPHCFWYTTYRGEGALDAEANSTKIAAVIANATGTDSRPDWVSNSPETRVKSVPSWSSALGQLLIYG